MEHLSVSLNYRAREVIWEYQRKGWRVYDIVNQKEDGSPGGMQIWLHWAGSQEDAPEVQGVCLDDLGIITSA